MAILILNEDRNTLSNTVFIGLAALIDVLEVQLTTGGVISLLTFERMMQVS